MDNLILGLFVLVVVAIAVLGASQTNNLVKACEAKGGALIQSANGAVCISGAIPL